MNETLAIVSNSNELWQRMTTNFRFPVSLDLRLDWSELDAFGHINNVMYFKYLQASRVNYWEKMGLAVLDQNVSIGPLLASTQCSFRKPLYYPGTIKIQVSVEFIKNTSFGLYHQILNEKGELAAEGHDVVVLYDYKTLEKVIVPDDLRAIIEALEGRSYRNS